MDECLITGVDTLVDGGRLALDREIRHSGQAFPAGKLGGESSPTMQKTEHPFRCAVFVDRTAPALFVKTSRSFARAEALNELRKEMP